MMMATDKLALLLRYAEQGYRLLPLWWIKADGACACGNPQCPRRNAGKHPISHLVRHGQHDASADIGTLTAWNQQCPQANWGLPMKANGLVAIDVDPRNGGDVTFEQLEAQHGPIQSSWHQRTGNGGFHLIYRAPQNQAFPGGLGAGVDIKHDGYVLTEPSKTNGQYSYVDDEGPLEGSAPPSAPDWLVNLSRAILQPQHAPIPKGGAIGFNWLGQDGMAELWSALSVIPNFERSMWVQVGMALHYTDPPMDGQGFALWERWSNLAPGSHKYNAKDQAYIWRSFSRHKETCLTLDSIYYWANQHGWQSHGQQAAESAVKATLDMLRHGPTLTLTHTALSYTATCPVPLIEETAAWLSSRTSYAYHDASMLGALVLCSASSARRYVGQDGMPAHMYCGLSAQTINELRYVLNGVETAMADAGLRRIVRSSRFGGISALYRTLLRSPAALYLTAEWETLLKFAKRQPSGTIDQVLNMLADLHGRKLLQIDSAEEFGLTKLTHDEQPVIRHPSLSMLALLSDSAFELLSKTSEIGRGASELMHTVICHPDALREISQHHADAPTPVGLISRIRQVRDLPNLEEQELDTDLARIFGDNCSVMNPRLIEVSAVSQLDTYDAEFSALSSDRRMLPIIRGAKNNFRRLCIALAAWNNPAHPLITRPIAEWAAGYMLHHSKASIDRTSALLNDGNVDVGQKIVHKVMASGMEGLSAREIAHQIWAYKKLDEDARAQLLQKLVNDGDIVSGSPTGTKRSLRYYSPQFAKPEAVNA